MDPTKVRKIDQPLIEGWLRDIMLTWVQLPPNPRTAWGFEVTLPPVGVKVLVYQMRQAPRGLMVSATMTVPPEQVAAFNQLDDDARRQFWVDLRATLSRPYIEFNLQGQALVGCPNNFTVMATRWDEGLNLDTFAFSISSVHKTLMDACALFDERLGVMGPSFGGDFAFKKSSIQ